MLKDGKPYTIENGWVDDGLLSGKTIEEQESVRTWIHKSIKPRKTPLMTRSSYGIKHILERDTGIYLTNNEFKDAMLLEGYHPTDPNSLNWHYCISKKSPAFNRKIRRRYRGTWTTIYQPYDTGRDKANTNA